MRSWQSGLLACVLAVVCVCLLAGVDNQRLSATEGLTTIGASVDYYEPAVGYTYTGTEAPTPVPAAAPIGYGSAGGSQTPYSSTGGAVNSYSSTGGAATAGEAYGVRRLGVLDAMRARRQSRLENRVERLQSLGVKNYGSHGG